MTVMYVRQITACPELATLVSVRRRSGRGGGGALAYRVFLCRRHRPLTDPLLWGWGRDSGPYAGEHRCGRVEDHRQAEELFESHVLLWLGHGDPVDGAPVGWPARLRFYVEDTVRLRGGQPRYTGVLSVLRDAVRTAEQPADTGDALLRVLALLAEAETLHTRYLRV